MSESVCARVCVRVNFFLMYINVCYISCVISLSTQSFAGTCRYIMNMEVHTYDKSPLHPFPHCLHGQQFYNLGWFF